MTFDLMSKTTTAPPRIPVLTWKISAVTGAGAFMAMLDSTVANLAIESIRSDLQSTLTLVQWVATGYLCALAVSLPTVGWLGKRFGYGRTWGGSLIAFVITSALCALAPEPISLIVARVLQGLAGGIMVPAGQAIIGSTAGKKELGRIMGLLGLVIALGPAIGPAVGGVLLEEASWRWLFWINVPLGIITLLAARRLVPGGRMDRSQRLDSRGFLLISLGLPLLLYGSTETGVSGGTVLTVGAMFVGLVLWMAFTLHAFRVPDPLIDLRLLRNKTFTTATLTTGLTGANMYGALLLLPLYFQHEMQLSLTRTGLLLLVMGLASALALPVGGTLTDRYSAGKVSLGGAVLLFCSSLPFLHSQILSPPVLLIALAMRGAGLALAQMPAMTAAYTAVTAEQMGDAATLVNITQRIGGAVGAICIVIMLQQMGNQMNLSPHVWASVVLSVISLLVVIVAVQLNRRTREQFK
ncbi:putative transport protein HsrA [Gimesia panareensis]|uniref:Putative transport protein HsrA n=2 Tax=Gimesia panareensis TaxID=2527978 RepID=A0A518FPD7_9PLAN|nr:putative transport protein HsrA [Gimesia panareensis]